ncbi:XRE family transcriptional regulator [Cupriavidus sp. UYMSc13B]|nr:XRE family transcriptional regulator [Cupriavidus sp. UYMSc13B]
MAISNIRVRIDLRTKEEASAALEAMGLTVSDAVRMLLKRIATGKALPLALITPNAATTAALREARAGGLGRFESLDDLRADLCRAGD